MERMMHLVIWVLYTHRRVFNYTFKKQLRCWSCSLREHLEHMALCLGEDDERVKNFWVRIKEQSRQVDTAGGVCYRTPDQGEQVDEAFYRQLAGASQSHILVLMGGSSHPHLCWVSWAHTVHEAPAEHWCQLSNTGGGEASEERCAAGPCTN